MEVEESCNEVFTTSTKSKMSTGIDNPVAPAAKQTRLNKLPCVHLVSSRELAQEIREKDEKINAFNEENSRLREEIKKLKTLALGQVAYLLEAEIAKVVLPKVNMGKTGVLKSMKHWLKKNSSNDKGKEAQERWNVLKDKLKWDEDDHQLALSLLKDIRIKDAHPEPVDLDEARKQLREGDYISDLNKTSCEEIIDMLVTLKNDSKDLK